MRTLRTNSLTNFSIYHRAVLTVVMLYITSSVFICFITEILYLLTTFLQTFLPLVCSFLTEPSPGVGSKRDFAYFNSAIMEIKLFPSHQAATDVSRAIAGQIRFDPCQLSQDFSFPLHFLFLYLLPFIPIRTQMFWIYREKELWVWKI